MVTERGKEKDGTQKVRERKRERDRKKRGRESASASARESKDVHWNLTLRMSVVFLIKINKVYSGFYVR